jgi:hypothetical protein
VLGAVSNQALNAEYEAIRAGVVFEQAAGTDVEHGAGGARPKVKAGAESDVVAQAVLEQAAGANVEHEAGARPKVKAGAESDVAAGAGIKH